MQPKSKIIDTDGGITVEFTGDFDRVDGWAEAREDLGLNKAGPDPVQGIEILEEEENYYDGSVHVAGYRRVVIRADDVDALKRASDRLYQQAEERFRYGMHGDAEDVQNFAGAIPGEWEIGGKSEGDE